MKKKFLIKQITIMAILFLLSLSLTILLIYSINNLENARMEEQRVVEKNEMFTNIKTNEQNLLDKINFDSVRRSVDSSITTLYIIIALIIIGVVCLVLCFYFKSQRPILDYTLQLKKYKLNGKKFLLIPKGTNELRLLADAYNQREMVISLMFEIYRSTSQIMNVQDILHKTLSMIKVTLDIDVIASYKKNHENDRLELKVSFGISDEDKVLIEDNNFQNVIYNKITTNNEPVFYSIKKEDTEELKIISSMGIKHFVIIPLEVSGKLEGVFFFAKKDEETFKDDEQWLLLSISRQLSTAIQNRFLFDSLNKELAFRKKAEDEMAIAKSEAENANKSKSEFFANMSHEIRTPINAIIGFNYLLEKTNLTNKQQDFVEKTISSTKHLLSIINDVLDFSKIEANKIILEDVAFDLYEVLNNTSNSIRDKAVEKGIIFFVSISSDVPQMIQGDSLRLNQVLLNLANNAIKFTQKGEVSITVTLDNKIEDNLVLKFVVKDTGIGMTKEQNEKIFKTFSQADMSTTRKYGGTGLGLSISKRLVELMGGEIYVKTKAGVGSKFIFTSSFKPVTEIIETENKQIVLKQLKVLLVSDNIEIQKNIRSQLERFNFLVNIVDSEDSAMDNIYKSLSMKTNDYDLVIIDWKLNNNKGVKIFEKINKEFAYFGGKVILLSAFHEKELEQLIDSNYISGIIYYPISQSQLYNKIICLFKHVILSEKWKSLNIEQLEKLSEIKGKKILLAEDNEMNQQVIKDILESIKVEVKIATNGIEAVRLVDENKFDLILMDLQMPKMDGFQATLKIREKFNKDELPIIVLTADIVSGFSDRLKEIGINDYASKPIEPKKLFSIIKKWIVKEYIDENIHEDLDESFLIELKLPNKLPGLNIKDGLAHLLWNEESYIKLIEKFQEIHSNDGKKLKEFLLKKEFRKISSMAHSIKGAAGNIGAFNLFDVSSNMEYSIKEKLYDDLAELINKFNFHMQETVNSIEVIIAKKTSIKEEVFIELNEDLIEDLKENIKELRVQLLDNNSKALNEMDKILKYLLNSKIKAKAEDLKKSIVMFEFEKALEILSDIEISLDIK